MASLIVHLSQISSLVASEAKALLQPHCQRQHLVKGPNDSAAQEILVKSSCQCGNAAALQKCQDKDNGLTKELRPKAGEKTVHQFCCQT